MSDPLPKKSWDPDPHGRIAGWWVIGICILVFGGLAVVGWWITRTHEAEQLERQRQRQEERNR